MQRASGAGHGLPRSLMQRLALLEAGLFPVSSHKRRPRPAKPPLRTRLRRMSTSFGLGVASGTALGGAALLALLLVNPEAGRSERQIEDAVLPAADAAGRTVLYRTLELSVPRSEDGRAPFPLRVTGAEAVDGARVVLRHLPEAVALTAGQRLDAQSWSLGLAELEGLHFLVGSGTPETFAVTVEVTSSGSALASTTAHVRLVSATAAMQEPRAGTPPVLVLEPFRTEVAAARGTAPELSAVSSWPVQSAPAAPPTGEAARPEAGAPHRPTGLSALGGPREGETAPAAGEGRRLWWSVPRSAWPFPGGDSPN